MITFESIHYFEGLQVNQSIVFNDYRWIHPLFSMIAGESIYRFQWLQVNQCIVFDDCRWTNPLFGMITGESIHCFECHSRDGSHTDCEDTFGPYNQTGYLLRRDCDVTVLRFEAFFCVKVQGVNCKNNMSCLTCFYKRKF